MGPLEVAWVYSSLEKLSRNAANEELLDLGLGMLATAAFAWEQQPDSQACRPNISSP